MTEIHPHILDCFISLSLVDAGSEPSSPSPKALFCRSLDRRPRGVPCDQLRLGSEADFWDIGCGSVPFFRRDKCDNYALRPISIQPVPVYIRVRVELAAVVKFTPPFSRRFAPFVTVRMPVNMSVITRPAYWPPP